MKGLVLSGGGASGCFSAGVLYRMFYHEKFDKIYGTSVGALNSVLLAQAYLEKSPGIIKEVWTERIKKNSDVFRQSFMKLLMFKCPLTFDPLSNLISEIADFEKIRNMEEEIVTTSVNILTGKTVYVSNKESSPEEFEKALLASASVPFFVSPVQLDKKILVDGGIRENAPVRKMMMNDDIDNILVVLASPLDVPMIPYDEGKKKFANTFRTLTRALNIMGGELTINDLKGIKNVNKLISDMEEILGKGNAGKIGYLRNKKFISANLIIPDEEVIEDLLEFNQEKLRAGFDMGYEYADRYIKRGPRFDLERLIHWTNYK